MAANLNKAMIIGHLGLDPELRYTHSASAVCNLRIATNERWTTKDGEPGERTEWHTVVVFGASAENCARYLARGSAVFVEGRLQTRSWEDDTGVTRYSTEIVASSVQFLRGQGEAQGPGTSPSSSDANDFDENDIPF